MVETAELARLIDWERLAIDGFFFQGKDGGEEIEYEFKRKGTTTHLLIDGNGSPMAFKSTAANGDERRQVEALLDHVEKHIGAALAEGIIPIIEADKGYDTEQLRDKFLRRKIFPWIYRSKKPGKEVEKVKSILKRIRWKVERTTSWLQRKFRRLALRWERKMRCWKGFLIFRDFL